MSFQNSKVIREGICKRSNAEQTGCFSPESVQRDTILCMVTMFGEIIFNYFKFN